MPLTKAQTLDRYFLEMRCKVLDIAAALDRIDRAEGDPPADNRLKLLKQAIEALLANEGNRAEKVQLIFSRPYDPNWRQELLPDLTSS